MHKNTFLLVLMLAIIAALLVGVNIGRKFQAKPDPAPPDSPAVTPTQTPQSSIFKNTTCGIALSLPPGTQAETVASRSARFVSTDQSVVQFACEREIPRFPNPTEQIDSIQVASISAKLYHTKSAKDDALFDALIFRNPNTAMDIYLAGVGSTFSAIIKSITILP